MEAFLSQAWREKSLVLLMGMGFLKPNDVIAVGTDPRGIFYAVVRNAFRMTYGFGFIYDRNFANPSFRGLDSNRFSRW